MSRIGRQPVPIPDGVTVDVKSGLVSVKGPKGELSQTVSPEMKITQGGGPEEGGDEAGAPSAILTPISLVRWRTT